MGETLKKKVGRGKFTDTWFAFRKWPQLGCMAPVWPCSVDTAA